MITVRECQYDEVEKFRKLKGDNRTVKRNADAICRSRDPVSRFVKKTSGTRTVWKVG